MRITLLTTVALLSTALTACGQQDSPTPPSASSHNESTTAHTKAAEDKGSATTPPRTGTQDDEASRAQNSAESTPKGTKSPTSVAGTDRPQDTGAQAVNYLSLTKKGTFLTPDKSVMCVVEESGKVMCAANTVYYDVPQAPQRCAGLDYGHSISATPNRPAHFDCGTDYVFSKDGKVLPVDVTLRGPQGLECTTTQSSVACGYNGKNSFIFADDNFTVN